MFVVAVTLRVRTGERAFAPNGASPHASLKASPTATLDAIPTLGPVPPGKAVVAGAPHLLHGDSQHTHRAHGRIPQQPRVRWAFHLDGPVEGQVVLSPDESTLYVATLGGTLWALDRAGKEHFHVSLGGRAYGTPTVGPDGTVYEGADGGAFFAIDKTGRVLWKLETRGDADTGGLWLDEGLVVFAAGPFVEGVRPGGVLAFRFQANGKVFTGPALTHRSPGHAPLVLVGSQDHHVYALTTRGELAWATDLGHDVDGEPVVGEDDAIFVGTDGGDVVRLDEAGHVVWRADVGGFVRGPLSLARDGDVLAGVYGASPRLVRLSPAGLVRGGFPVRGAGTPETGVHGGALEDDDGTLVFGAQDGLVHVVDRSGGERWSYDARSDVDAPVTLLGDGTLLVGDYDGDLLAFGSEP